MLPPSGETTMNDLIKVDDWDYDIYRQFHDNGHEWDEGISGRKQFSTFYPYFERIKNLVYASPDGRLDGFGIKKFPEVSNTSGNI